MKSITLYFREGGSDKVYQTAVEPSGDLFIVTFAYCRRGATLQTGVKTSVPVDLQTAERVFDRLVKEKTDKGYTPGETGTPYTHTEHAEKDTGIRPQLLNSIDDAEALRLVADPDWCLQEKKDGRRMLVKKDSTTIIGINRRGLVAGLPSQVVRALEWIDTDFILDGECVGDLFYAFDLLSSYARDWRDKPYGERLYALNRLLERHSNGNVLILDTYLNAEQKLERLKAFQEFHAEGVVCKLLSAPYTPGRPSQGGDALKYKFTTTGSFIVAGANKCRSVKLKLHGEKTDCGNVTIPPNHDIPKTGAVVEIRYLYAYCGGSLYQPVFLGVRDDIAASECLRGQLKFKREEADDDGE